MDLQNAFGKYLVLCEKDDIIVTKNGKNVPNLYPIAKRTNILSTRLKHLIISKTP